MKTYNISVILCSILLSGCLHTTPVIPTDKPIEINPKLLEPCQDLYKLPEGPITFTEVLETSVKNTELYLECRRKHDRSIILIKELTNKK